MAVNPNYVQYGYCNQNYSKNFQSANKIDNTSSNVPQNTTKSREEYFEDQFKDKTDDQLKALLLVPGYAPVAMAELNRRNQVRAAG